MKRIRLSTISAGTNYEHTVFLPTGQKLLSAQVVLTEAHVQALRRHGIAELVLADSLDELEDNGLISKVDETHLSVGSIAGHDILGAGGNILVEKGQVIEAHHIEALRQGAYMAGESPRNKKNAHWARERILLGDVLVQELDQAIEDLDRRVRPREDDIWFEHFPDNSPWPEIDELMALREKQVEKLKDLYARIEAGVTVGIEHFEKVADWLMERLLNHRERFAQLALLAPRREDYLPDHAFCTSVLAMAVTAQLCWSDTNVRQMGIAGLLFDVGMLLIPQRIRLGGNELSEIDRNRVFRHPIYSLSMLESVVGTPLLVRLCAFQHHERDNGTGYPQGLRNERVHDMSRVLAVCDVFAASTSPRHYRQSKLPYVAMEEMIRAAASNVFYKPAVRALVQSVGLFPVGSYVKLSTGRIARVLASNPNHLDKPMVAMVDRAELIDLARVKSDDIRVIRPVPEPQNITLSV